MTPTTKNIGIASFLFAIVVFSITFLSSGERGYILWFIAAVMSVGTFLAVFVFAHLVWLTSRAFNKLMAALR